MKEGANTVIRANRIIAAIILAFTAMPAASQANSSTEKDGTFAGGARVEDIYVHSLSGDEIAATIALEGFLLQAAAAKVLGNGYVPDGLPTDILLLGSKDEAEVLGYSAKASGDFLAGISRQTVVLRDHKSLAINETLRLWLSRRLFNERYPAWLAYGLTQYFALAGRAGEGEYRVGVLDETRLDDTLSETPWHSTHQVLEASDHYGRWTPWDRRVYHAQAALLVHYLLSRPNGEDAIKRYMQLLKSGQFSLAAFEAAFGESPQTLHKKLKIYLRNGEFDYRSFDIRDLRRSNRVVALGLPQSQAYYRFARLAGRRGNSEMARYWFRAGIVDTASRARAIAGIAGLPITDGNADSPIARFEEASRLAPEDASVQLDFATYLLRRAWDSENREEQRALLASAERHVGEARTLDSTNAAALVASAAISSWQGNYEQAAQWLEQAYNLRPASLEIALRLVTAYERTSKPDSAGQLAKWVKALTPPWGNDGALRAREVVVVAPPN